MSTEMDENWVPMIMSCKWFLSQIQLTDDKSLKYYVGSESRKSCSGKRQSVGLLEKLDETSSAELFHSSLLFREETWFYVDQEGKQKFVIVSEIVCLTNPFLCLYLWADFTTERWMVLI